MEGTEMELVNDNYFEIVVLDLIILQRNPTSDENDWILPAHSNNASHIKPCHFDRLWKTFEIFYQLHPSQTSFKKPNSLRNHQNSDPTLASSVENEIDKNHQFPRNKFSLGD